MKELKEDRLYIRLSTEQKEKLKEEAKKMNLTISKYIRKMLKLK
jgi:antitoxin component of RelBE/YafQ-DinJ toxin-antitoxin module